MSSIKNIVSCGHAICANLAFHEVVESADQ